ncbi:hypothetical protein MKW94_023352 [Papaver nudicaule]|uniref:Uncharacterized protein n=1 Tax=Papaver nudicaule TaxID=74823 RepID=A0AA41V086_PAPNU|nr:hypothetical protein [Papaver nudicaule]
MCYVGKATKIFICVITILVAVGIILTFSLVKRHNDHKNHNCSGQDCQQPFTAYPSPVFTPNTYSPPSPSAVLRSPFRTPPPPPYQPSQSTPESPPSEPSPPSDPISPPSPPVSPPSPPTETIQPPPPPNQPSPENPAPPIVQAPVQSPPSPVTVTQGPVPNPPGQDTVIQGPIPA